MPSSYELFLKIADLVFCVTSPDQTVKLKLDEAALRFSCHEAGPDVQITARWCDLSNGAITGRKIFDPGPSWKLYEQEDVYLFAFYAGASGSVPYKAARMTRDLTSGEVLLHAPFFNPNEALFPLDYPLDELLFVNFLSRGRGAELHACGVTDAEGNGHLFVGQSGAGKSTIARLLTEMPGSAILSDDRIVVRMKDGRPWIYGTPWHGEAEFSSPDSAPLRTILFLAKDSTNKLVPLPEATVVGRLLACSFPPFFDAKGLDFTLSFFSDVTRSVTSYELRFRPDNEVFRIVERLATDRCA
jgi:hypothetical protein